MQQPVKDRRGDDPNFEDRSQSSQLLFEGGENCGDERLAANDFLGTQLALGYAITPKNLPVALRLR